MKQQVVFFDDICVLCSRSVRFIYRHDPRGRFLFASFDSEAFREIAGLLPETRQVGNSDGAQASPGETEVRDSEGAQEPSGSVVLYRRGKVYLRSAAALRIAMLLRFPMSLLAAGFLLPPFIRNGIYDWIARNRYRWFGKRESCFMPDGELRERFLE